MSLDKEELTNYVVRATARVVVEVVKRGDIGSTEIETLMMKKHDLRVKIISRKWEDEDLMVTIVMIKKQLEASDQGGRKES
jgi:hypothetical protein